MERAGLISRESGATVEILFRTFAAPRVVAVHSLIAGWLSNEVGIGGGSRRDVTFVETSYEATLGRTRI